MDNITEKYLNKLLNNSTPGPWTYMSSRYADERYIISEDTCMCISVNAENEGSSCTDKDLELAALAPELAEEVLRLRSHNNAESEYTDTTKAAYNALDMLEELTHETYIDSGSRKTIRHIIEAVSAALPPKPHNTMAHIEWDPNIHYLAEAHHDILGTVVMAGIEPSTKEILCVYTQHNYPQSAFIDPEKLVPTGEQYRKESNQ